MADQAIIAIISASSAIIGAAIGTAGSFLANYKIKKLDYSQSIDKELRTEKRQCAVSFISEANRLAIHSMHEKQSDALFMSKFGELLAEFEILYSNAASKSAREVFESILLMHAQIKEEKEPYPKLRESLINHVKNELEIKT